MAFSANARYLAVVDLLRPNFIWVWDIPQLSLKSVLIQIDAIKCKTCTFHMLQMLVVLFQIYLCNEVFYFLNFLGTSFRL